MPWLLPLLLAAPLASIACLFLRGPRASAAALVGGTGTAFVLALLLAWRVSNGGAVIAAHGWLQADALSALIACLVTGLTLASALYGIPYMAVVRAAERAEERWVPGRYEALFLGLLACLLTAALANNLGLVWIAIEGTTLTSAMLVGYFRRPESIEAAWKYLILCSVGISLALLATVLLYYSAVSVFGEGGQGLQWTALREAAPRLDPRFVKLAFLFALVGYGTKAGLAPMHTWLPDAHSQAPAPVSALMSTGLLATSLSVLLRFHAITAACVGPGWSGGLLALFGGLSMVIAIPFMLVQGEYKRLLAYSSIEHTGFATLAIGLGTPLAVFGGLLHLVVQSLAKALAFLVGGSIGHASGSSRMDHWSGLLEASPVLGVLLVGAGLGIAGLPPTGTFVSEWLALAGGFASSHPVAAATALVALVAVFMGLVFHWTRMALGRPREGFDDRMPALSRLPMWLLLVALVFCGFYLPSPVRTLIEQAAAVVRP